MNALYFARYLIIGVNIYIIEIISSFRYLRLKTISFSIPVAYNVITWIRNGLWREPSPVIASPASFRFVKKGNTGPNNRSCARLTGPNGGTQNCHVALDIASISREMHSRTCSNVDDFVDARMTKPICVLDEKLLASVTRHTVQINSQSSI